MVIKNKIKINRITMQDGSLEEVMERSRSKSRRASYAASHRQTQQSFFSTMTSSGSMLLVRQKDRDMTQAEHNLIIGLREKARRVWVSSCIFMILLPFIDGYHIVCLQSANKFMYEIAVSRFQRIIRFRGPLYFTWAADGILNNSILQYSQAFGLSLLDQESQNDEA